MRGSFTHRLIACAVGLTIAVPLAAGPLSPPPGPVASTQKMLSEVEPRIPIGPDTTPGDAQSLFRISQPGSYYLTGNVTGVADKVGIRIDVPDNGPGVTLDLMGFELVGVPGSIDGIATRPVSLIRNVAVHNGVIRAWGDDGIDCGAQNSRFWNLRLESNGRIGIIATNNTSIEDCSATLNSSTGFLFSSGVITRCIAKGNGAGIAAASAVISHCLAEGNAGDGILAGLASAVSDCVTKGNSGRGIYAQSGKTTISGCTANSNQNGIVTESDVTIIGCTASSNTEVGISTGFSGNVMNCTVTSNGANGIQVGAVSRVVDNLSSGNGQSVPGSGIYTAGNRSRIEGNSVIANDLGILLDGNVSGNVVVRNHAVGNGINYLNPASNNFIGTIITTSGAMNSAANNLINLSF